MSPRNVSTYCKKMGISGSTENSADGTSDSVLTCCEAIKDYGGADIEQTQHDKRAFSTQSSDSGPAVLTALLCINYNQVLLVCV